MSNLVSLIERAAIGLYSFGGLVLLWNIWRWVRANGELREAEFELERELAYTQQSIALTWMLLALEFVLAVVAVVYVIAPTIRADAVAPVVIAPNATVVPDRFETALPGQAGTAVNIQETANAASISGESAFLTTPEPSPTPVGTIIAGMDESEGCQSDEAKLVIPVTGLQVFDTLTVQGTAFTEGFAFYRFEMNGPSTGGKFALASANQTTPIRELGILGQVSLAPFQPGVYQFRLAVFDNQSTLKAFCTVSVMLTLRPVPTLTPTAVP